MNLIPQPRELTLCRDEFYILPQKAQLSMPVLEPRLSKAISVLFASLSVSVSGALYCLCCGDYPEEPEALETPQGYDYYELSVTAKSLVLKSASAAGLFCGIQTLRQLLCSYKSGLPLVQIRDWSDTRLRCDHYDLRTIHPTYAHLAEYIEEMAFYKINALLVEYEDKLPFQDLKQLRHPNGMTEPELERLLAAAYDNFIEVIPLQQTYGHLEYVLKHPEFIHLREQQNHVAELCPMKEESFALVCRMLKDISDLHPDSRYLHLGGDEVWSIGTCSACRSQGLSHSALFINYINRVAEYVISLGKQPIIWHDMLKEATKEELALLDKRITVAVWIYNGRHLSERALDFIGKFHAAGISVLAGPSVRCWDDSAAQNYPVVQKRLHNLSQWLPIVRSQQLPGIIFTNWAASFSLGNPYGLFESTRYLTFYGNEQAWNPQACTESYPKRFFALYHGIEDSSFLSDSFTLEDYYLIPDQYLPLCKKNQLTARLLDLMKQYDYVMKTGLPLQDMLFRADMFPDSEEIITFLKGNFKKNYTLLDQLKPQLKEVLNILLPPHLLPVYLHSRFFLPELYRKEAQRLLD